MAGLYGHHHLTQRAERSMPRIRSVQEATSFRSVRSDPNIRTDACRHTWPDRSPSMDSNQSGSALESCIFPDVSPESLPLGAR